jgi:hypothetical protein
MAGEAVARQAGIENGDLAAGTAELQGTGETGKAAADDDDVIHGDWLRVVDGGLGLGMARNIVQRYALDGGGTCNHHKEPRCEANTQQKTVEVIAPGSHQRMMSPRVLTLLSCDAHSNACSIWCAPMTMEIIALPSVEANRR